MLTVAEFRCTTAETTLLEVDALELAAGERLGLVGASGSGKSLLLRALVGLPPRGIDVRGELRFAGVRYDLGRPATLAGLRGRGLAYLSQSAAASLDPTRRVDAQLAEVMSLHLQREAGWTERDAAAERRRRLAEVALDPALADAYPHELSGGEAQRVALALALACRPRVLLADEPTANLDTLSGARVLAAIDDAVTRDGLAMILVSHDLAEVGARCPQLLVLDGGRPVDRGATVDVLEGDLGSRSPATRRLVAAARAREAAIAGATGGAG